MSFWIKAFVGFSGLGFLSSAPLVSANGEQDIKFKFSKEGEQLMSQEITKILEKSGKEGYRGCVALKDSARRGYFPTLYVCIKPETTDKSFLFHYDSSKRNPSERVNKITQIQYQYSWLATVHLENGSQKTLRTPPFWMGKWKDIPFKPEEHCKLSKKDVASYTLTCSSKSDISPELTQEIS